MLTVALKPERPKTTGREIADKWFLAQWEIKCGHKPTIIKDRDDSHVFQLNAGRARAPTTVEVLQERIDHNTRVHENERHYEARDYSDDEEEDPEDELSMTIETTGDVTKDTEDEEDLSPIEYEAQSQRVTRTTSKSRTTGRTSRYSVKRNTIKSLWLKSQAELSEGKQPTILRKYGDGYRIQDLRKYHKKFKHEQRRSDQYIEIELNLSGPRSNISPDYDENEDSELQREETGFVVEPSSTRYSSMGSTSSKQDDN